MNCDDLLELASSGDQDVEGLPEYLDHLDACARCRDEAPALLAAARAIRAAPPSVFAGHPASEQIVMLALNPEDASLDVHRQVAEHVSHCPTCAAELAEVRRAEQKRVSRRSERPALGELIHALGRTWPDLTRGRLPAAIALAASLAVVLLAYPAFLGLRDLPLIKGQLQALEMRAAQLEAQTRDLSDSLAKANKAPSRDRWSGPLRLFALTSPLRGETVTRSVRLDPAAPYVLIGVRPILPEESSQSDVYRIVIVGPDGREVWHSQLRVEEIRRLMRDSGALIFPIPSDVIPTGKYDLRVLPEKSPRALILEIPFQIDYFPSPTATNPPQK